MGLAFIVLLAAGVMAAVNIVSAPLPGPASPPRGEQQQRRSGATTDASVSQLQKPQATANDLLVGGDTPAASSGFGGASMAGQLGNFVRSPTMPNGTFVQSPVGNLNATTAPSANSRPAAPPNPIGN